MQQLEVAGQAIPQPLTVNGLIDTGAEGTCIDPHIARDLGLSPVGQGLMLTPSTGDAPVPVNKYDIGILISATATTEPHTLPSLIVMESKIVNQGISVLIGRDILEGCLFVYDGQSGLFSLAF
jgi:Aspartyl protease